MMIAAQPDREPHRSPAGAATVTGPTALRIILGGQLRRLRESVGITRSAAVEVIRASEAKLSRLEMGRVSFKERDLRDLLTLYGVDEPEEREAFLGLARQANAPGWWHNYGDVLPGWCETYVGLEQAASTIRSYEIQFVPGLLQNEDYARAVVRFADPDGFVEERERRLNLRMTRQKYLSQPRSPKLWAVVDEAALRRPFGGRQVMRAQLRYLIKLTELPNVTVQIVPFGVGGHAASGGAFTLLRFAEPDLPDIVYLEHLTSALYLDKRQDVDHYLRVMERLCLQAEPETHTAALLSRIIDEM